MTPATRRERPFYPACGVICIWRLQTSRSIIIVMLIYAFQGVGLLQPSCLILPCDRPVHLFEPDPRRRRLCLLVWGHFPWSDDARGGSGRRRD